MRALMSRAYGLRTMRECRSGPRKKKRPREDSPTTLEHQQLKKDQEQKLPLVQYRLLGTQGGTMWMLHAERPSQAVPHQRQPLSRKISHINRTWNHTSDVAVRATVPAPNRGNTIAICIAAKILCVRGEKSPNAPGPRRTLSSHLTLRAPTTPGTTALTGKPWSLGMGSPFISKASRTSPFGSTAMPAGMEEP